MPKSTIRIKNIYYMLSYAYRSLQEKGYESVAAEEFGNTQDLLATIIVRGTANQIRRGLHRDYVAHEETVAGVRGQISVGATVKRLSHIQGRLVCRHDEFTEDSAHNRALKATMAMFLRYGRLRPEIREALRRLLGYFGRVGDVELSTIRWDTITFHRNNASYRMLLGICRLAVQGLLLTTRTGEHRLAAWFDDSQMYSLYERFVREYYRQHHPELAPRVTTVEWNAKRRGGTTDLPVMRTDITLTSGERSLIIDTKYYGRTIQGLGRRGRATLISENIYQMFAYVKNCDRAGSGNVAGALLYAKTEESVTPDDDFDMDGSLISLKTLDLGGDWRAIVAQLEDLCAWLKRAAETVPARVLEEAAGGETPG
jgi:5-methylcytosine-specific restriction enzyme subunit McrC